MGGAASTQTSIVVQADTSQTCNKILQSVDAVFAHLAIPCHGESPGVPAERLGHAMCILGMNPSQNEVETYLDQLGRPTHLDEETFRNFLQEELRKYFSRVQAVADYLKQYDQGTKGALSREELQEAIRGSGLSLKQLQVPSNDSHLDIVELSKNFVELGNLLQETKAPSRMACEDSEDPTSPMEDEYDLADPKAFARFLQDADIRLIRLEYLVHLVLSKRLLPRRQEAELEVFTKDGETRTALVSHEEVQRWSEGNQAALICSISHAWETREHPDPCSHQLQQVVSHCGLFGAAFEADVWIFYDYTSLFQFERTEKSHEMSFRRSMANMHLLYAHEFSLTFRIQNLTSEDAWKQMLGNDSEMVQVWVQGQGLEEKPLKALVANRTPYGERGWCRAEIEWSSLRSVNAQFQQIDKAPSEHHDGDKDFNARLPMTPEDFQRQMEQATFTHRSDASAVIHLQAKIFVQKVAKCEDLFLKGLAATEMLALARALPQYTKLKSLRIQKFRCGEADATALAEAVAKSEVEKLEISSGGGAILRPKDLAKSEVEKLETSRGHHKSGLIMVKALAEGLKASTSLRDINLFLNSIGDEGAQALAEGLKAYTSLRDIHLGSNKIGDEGAQALAEGLKASTSLRDINLGSNKIGDEGAQALAEGLKASTSLRDINLSGNGIGDKGAQALAEGLKASTSLRDIHLGSNKIGDEGAQALLESVKESMTLRKMDLCYTEISHEMMKALKEAIDSITSRNKQIEASEEAKVGCRKPFEAPVRLQGLAQALKANRTVTEIYLPSNNSGDAGAKALAEALKANKTITKINLDKNSIGDAGAEALAEALKANGTVEGIILQRNNIGDDGAKALAEALKANKTVKWIILQRNNIGDDGAKALKEVMEEKRKMGSELQIC